MNRNQWINAKREQWNRAFSPPHRSIRRLGKRGHISSNRLHKVTEKVFFNSRECLKAKSR